MVCAYIASLKYFDTFILFMIMLSSIQLAVLTYFVNTTNEDLKAYFSTVDLIFNIIFLVEALLKIVKSGFVVCKNSYLRDSWNQIDFIIVVSG